MIRFVFLLCRTSFAYIQVCKFNDACFRLSLFLAPPHPNAKSMPGTGIHTSAIVMSAFPSTRARVEGEVASAWVWRNNDDGLGEDDSYVRLKCGVEVRHTSHFLFGGMHDGSNTTAIINQQPQHPFLFQRSSNPS